jgi:predicted ester cyclase
MLDTEGVIGGIFGEAATGDLDGVMSWWAPDGILEDITLAKAFRGRGEIRPYLEMYFAALPGISFEPIRLVCSGPAAVVEWAQSSVVQAPLDGTPGVGTELFLRAVDIFHITGGLVQHESSRYGTAGCASGWAGTALPRPRRSR